MNRYTNGFATATTAEAPGPPVTAATDDDAMLSLARERFKQCVEAEAEYRRLALEDLSFYASDQSLFSRARKNAATLWRAWMRYATKNSASRSS